jgi:hypothetical protein
MLCCGSVLAHTDMHQQGNGLRIRWIFADCELASKQVSTSFFKKVSKNGAVALTCLFTVASN